MMFKRYVRPQAGLQPIIIAPVVNIVFLLVMFLALTSSFAVQTGIDIKLPKAVTSDMITQQITITVSDENVLSFNGKIISISELKERLSVFKQRQVPVLIKADRRASIGRVVDIWDLCRQLGLEKVNIAASQRN